MSHFAASNSFQLQQQHELSSARTGLLQTATTTLPTPNAFFYSKKGNPAHLTPDLLQQVPQFQALHMSVSEFITTPGEETIRKMKNRLHDYVRLPNHVLYMSVRDPLVDGLAGGNDSGVSVLSSQGTTRLNAATYASLVAAYQPDIVVSLSDEIASTLATNRARKSSQRSVMWVDAMQKTLAEKAAAENDASGSRKTLFFASVQGGADLEQRRISCEQYSLRVKAAESASPHDPYKLIDGFVIGGLGTGEDVEKRDEIVTQVVSQLPPSKPRVLSSTSNFNGAPHQVLHAISQGIDLFEVSYTHQLTLLGQASVFQYSNFTSSPSACSSLPVTKLNLRDAQYAHDKRPLLEGCTCFTCKNHTRAYIHHLLNVHEMLAPILLDLHNIHHYTSFLSEVRAVISNNSAQAFLEYKQNFLKNFLPNQQNLLQGKELSQPQHANQVGRAMLGPFSSFVSAQGEYLIRRILPKDNAQVADIIRNVLTTFGAIGPGYASSDKEVDSMYQNYETHNLPHASAPPADSNAMEDVATSSPPAAALPTLAPTPLRSMYFVVTHESDDSKVLGGAGIAPLEGSDGSIAELRKMYFVPELRGKGVGQKLIETCIENARKLEFKQLYLETLSSMDAAQALYKKNGFRQITDRMGATGHFSVDLRYIKDL